MDITTAFLLIMLISIIVIAIILTVIFREQIKSNYLWTTIIISAAIIILKCLLCLSTLYTTSKYIENYSSTINEIQPSWVGDVSSFINEENKPYYEISVDKVIEKDINMQTFFKYLVNPTTVDVSELYDIKVEFKNTIQYNDITGILSEYKIVDNMRHFFVFNKEIVTKVGSEYDNQLCTILENKDSLPEIQIKGKFRNIIAYKANCVKYTYEPIDVEIIES